MGLHYRTGICPIDGEPVHDLRLGGGKAKIYCSRRCYLKSLKLAKKFRAFGVPLATALGGYAESKGKCQLCEAEVTIGASWFRGPLPFCRECYKRLRILDYGAEKVQRILDKLGKVA